jgi:glycosyltransferase 2 family protein
VARGRARRLVILGSALLGLAILVALASSIDLAETVRQLRKVGLAGFAAFFVNIAITLAGPIVAWHLLLRGVGIRVAPATTVASSLMGFACNLISPMSYFGGESVRTCHIAAVTGAPKRRVLATIVVAELQVLAALTGLMLAALVVAAAGASLGGTRLALAVAGGIGLAVLVGVLVALLVGRARPSVRILDLLIRCRIFPTTLQGLRDAAVEMEQTIREILRRRRGSLLLGQAAALVGPIAHFLRPPLYFWLLGKGTGELPGLSDLSAFFVFSQLVYMLPTTPAGLGVYEGGVIGLFRMLSWNPSDGAAYGILLRLDDVIFVLVGFTLVARFGLSRWIAAAREP